MTSSSFYVGLMSGTSVDAVDGVLADLSGDAPEVIAHIESDIPGNLREDILALSTPGDDQVDLLGRCDRAVGELFAATAQQLLARAGVQPGRIAAIGSHGQTIRHRPPQQGEPQPFTLQIGDPNIIASRTGITTVADFRRRDMSVGGPGRTAGAGLSQRPVYPPDPQPRGNQSGGHCQYHLAAGRRRRPRFRLWF